MIVGITGAICAGKSQLAKYLIETHGFEAINVMEIFKKRLRKSRHEIWKRRKPLPQAKDPQEESRLQEEAIEEEKDAWLGKPNSEIGIEPSNEKFCYAYYQAEYKRLRK